MNGLKTMVLMVTLTLMLVFVGGFLGGKSGMTFALIMAFGINFITYWFSDKIVLKMYGAKQVTAAEARSFIVWSGDSLKGLNFRCRRFM